MKSLDTLSYIKIHLTPPSKEKGREKEAGTASRLVRAHRLGKAGKDWLVSKAGKGWERLATKTCWHGQSMYLQSTVINN